MSEDRLIVGIGEGKFNVIAGHKLNAEPLTRAEADRLAHEPVKPAAKLPPREAPPPPPKRKPAAQSAPQPAPERSAAMNEVLAAADRAGMGDGDDGENGDLILSIPNTLISPLFLNHRIRARGDRDKRAISPFSPSPPSASRQLLGSFLSGLR